MSFDVNVGRPEPMIKASASMNNDGGSGGNTGYMMRGKKKKDNPFGSVFSDKNDETDSFQFSTMKMPKEMEEENNSSWLQKLMKKF